MKEKTFFHGVYFWIVVSFAEQPLGEICCIILTGRHEGRVLLQSDRDPPSSGTAPRAWSTSGWPDGSSSSLCEGVCAAERIVPFPSRSRGPAWRSRSSGLSQTIHRPSLSPRPRRLPLPHRHCRRQLGCSPGAHASEPASPRTADIKRDNKKIYLSVINRQAFNVGDGIKVINHNLKANLLQILHLQGCQEETSRCQWDDSEKSARTGRRQDPMENKRKQFLKTANTIRLPCWLSGCWTKHKNDQVRSLNLPLIRSLFPCSTEGNYLTIFTSRAEYIHIKTPF